MMYNGVRRHVSAHGENGSDILTSVLWNDDLMSFIYGV
jgi:hypothetical protein